MDLPRQEGIFGNVCIARVVVQWQEEQPGDTHQDTKEGDVWRELKKPPVAAQQYTRGCEKSELHAEGSIGRRSYISEPYRARTLMELVGVWWFVLAWPGTATRYVQGAARKRSS